MIQVLETLLPYLPPTLLRALLEDPERWFDPVEVRMVGAALHVDLTASPLMNGELARAGFDEPDVVSRELDEYVAPLYEVVQRHGGDLARISGGTMLALFPASGKHELGMATRRAVQAAGDIRERVAADGGVPRIGVGAGEIVTCEVGGIYERWNYIVAGDAVVQSVLAAEETAAGVPSVIAPGVGLSQRARAVVHPGELAPTRRRDPRRELENPDLDLDALDDATRRFVPGPVSDWLQHGLREWLTVLQPMCVLWVRVRGVNYRQIGVAQVLHGFVREFQESVVEREGVVGEVTVDAEGTVLWALFGAPPMSRQDDALRAVRSALAIQSMLASEGWQEAGLGGTLGLASGPLFAGPVGTQTRREYILAGKVVRRARALAVAARDGEILCDGETYRQVRSRIACDVLPSATLDRRAGETGDRETVAVYRPYRQIPSQSRVRQAIVGRMAERVLFAERLGQLQRGASGGVIVLEGEAGIGKSRLVSDLRRQADVVGVRTLLGRAEALDRATAYHGWRAVFGELLGVEGLAAPEARRARALAELDEIADYYGQAGAGIAEARDEILGYAPLLGDVVALDIPETELTRQMSGAVRASNTRALLRRMLEYAVLRGYRVVILEDGHWLDSSSWALALDVVKHIRTLLLVIATRPLPDPVPGEYAQLLAMPGAHAVRLGPLTSEDVKTLVCRRLGVESLPPSVEEVIREKAKGHPLLGEELAYVLRDAGVIEVAGGQCKLVEDTSLESVRLPESIGELVAERIEQLSPSHQLTLKVASVIGRVFPLELLREVHPVASDKPQLVGQLATLAALDITPLETPDPDRSYRFKHTITREVAYDLLQSTHRTQVHAAIAEWYESNHADDRAPYFPLLVYHWRRAGDVWRTIIYLESAGEQALERGAHHEAVRFLRGLLELSAGSARSSSRRGLRPVEIERNRRARWERMLGRAHLGLGDLVESRRRFENSLVALGYPLPQSRGQRTLGFVRQAMTQARNRFWSRKQHVGGAAGREALLEAARTYADILLIYTLVGDSGDVAVSYCVLMIVNLSEAAGGRSPELIEGYALVSVLVGDQGWRELADDYARKALEGARASEDLACLGSVLNTIGDYDTGLARWGQAEERLAESVAARERLGDLRLGDSLSSQICMFVMRGDFDRARAANRRLLEFARRLDSHLMRAWSLRWTAIERMDAADDHAGAREAAESWWALIEGRGDRLSELGCHTLRALLALRTDGAVAARAEYLRAAAIAEDVRATTPAAVLTRRQLAELALALWESEGSRVAKRRAKQACAALMELAGVYPVALPSAWMWDGVYAWMSGRQGRASESWRRALTHARHLRMPYDEALVHVTIARRGREPVRDHLERACALFEALGHDSALEHARADLAALPSTR